MMKETPRIMYVNKMNIEDSNNSNNHDEDDKSSLTLLNPLNYESTGSTESLQCCKYESNPGNGSRPKNFESERGKLIAFPLRSKIFLDSLNF